MDASTRARVYDLFKLIVAILLLLLFLWLLQRSTARPFASAPTLTPFPPPTNVNPILSAGTATPGPPTSPAQSNPPALVASLASPTSPPPSLTPASEASPPVSPTPTAPASFAPTGTQPPSGVPTLTPMGTSETPTIAACDETASRSRLQPGMTAVILRRLNFRSSPGIRDNWLRTNLPGTRVEVVAGPECVPHLSGAYVWWQIRLPAGEVGWSAEGSIHGTFYFMEPVE